MLGATGLAVAGASWVEVRRHARPANRKAVAAEEREMNVS